MPIKLAAFVPHPLPLIPSLGKENFFLLERTNNAYKKLADNLLLEKIETIIIISSHGPIRPDIFSVNISSEFEINFEEFGDFSAKLKVNGELELAQTIRKTFLEDKNFRALSEEILDHGCGVPLFTIGQVLKKIEIVPLYISGTSLKDHYLIGQTIAKAIEKNKKNIAIIASGDLSHSLTHESPAEYSPRAVKFDQRLVEYFRKKSVEEILNIEENLIAEVKPCGLRSMALMFGTLIDKSWEPENITYEAPFGVGYLTAVIKIN